jgi:flagellar biosynthesis chaperone FliJ
LLRIRQVEEKQAEIDLAAAQRAAAGYAAALASARRARDAWVDDHLDRTGHDGNGGATPLVGLPLSDGPDGRLVAHMEGIERDAEHRLEVARRHVDERRATLMDAQRRRQVVENLHRATLEAEARVVARRAQAELDDLAGIAAKSREHRG